METKVKSGGPVANCLLAEKMATSQWLPSMACGELVDRGRNRERGKTIEEGREEGQHSGGRRAGDTA